MLSRRSLLFATAALAKASGPLRLYIGNYGMQPLEPEAALAAIRKIGYEGAELTCIPGWPTEPFKLDAAARRRLRDTAFPIPTLLENFNTLAPQDAHNKTLDRIRAAAALAHDLAPANPPILQSVLGGRPADWPAVRAAMASRLADWARVASENHLQLAVKAHISSAVDTPEKLIALLDDVHHPALRGIYDYGHFQILKLDLEKTLEQLLPRSAFITLKDSKLVDGKPQFLLPGDGAINYARYFAKLRAMRWKGWMLVEISRQLQTQPGYDPIAAAQKSYNNIAPLLSRSAN